MPNDVLVTENGDFKEGVMNGLHYTPLGTKYFATELKRSLYAKEPLQTAPQRTQQHSLLRPPYLSQHTQKPEGRFPRQHSTSPSNRSGGTAENLLTEMSALLQKWQNGSGQ